MSFMLGTIYAGVANKPTMLSVFMLSIIMLNVVAPSTTLVIGEYNKTKRSLVMKYKWVFNGRDYNLSKTYNVLKFLLYPLSSFWRKNEEFILPSGKNIFDHKKLKYSQTPQGPVV
jgi:hypothetical protein